MTLPTIDIKGKQYVLVKDRIMAFNELYPNGCIQTELVSPIDAKTIIMKAIVTPDIKNPLRVFVDYSQATIGQGMVNTTAALENASTSAVGRCLAYLGIGIIESIASADEIVKATTTEQVEEEVGDYTREPVSEELKTCSAHEEPAVMKKGFSKTKNKDYWYHDENGKRCFGSGYLG